MTAVDKNKDNIAIYTFNLTCDVAGKQIADVVESIANANECSFYAKRMVINDVEYWNIGQESLYPYKNLLVSAYVQVPMSDGFGMEFDGRIIHSRVYPIGTTITIRDAINLSDLSYPVGYTDDDVIEAVRQFRDNLQEELL